MTELPSGWARASLGEVSRKIQYGYTASSSHSAIGPQLLRITDIQNGVVDWSKVPRVEAHGPELAQFVLEAGDIVFARSGATVGKSFLVFEPPERAIYASYLIRVQTDHAVTFPKFAALYFQSPEYWEQIREGASGTGQPNFNGSKLDSLSIPLPPLAEQRRIVAKLDRVMARTARARAELARIPALIAHHKRAILAAAFEGTLTKEWRTSNDAPEWSEARLESVCTSITDGDHQAPPRADNGIPFITISAMNDGEIRLERASRFVPVEYFEELDVKRRPQSGDVLFSVTGSIGISAAVTGEDRFVFQRHIAILRPSPGYILQAFLVFLLRDERIQDQARAAATGTAQLTIPLGGLRRFRIMLPSLPEQAEIVRRIESAFAWLDKVAHEHAQATRLLDHLDQKLLAKAFRGELVAQDPADEPAATLLARIRAEREGAALPARKRKARA